MLERPDVIRSIGDDTAQAARNALSEARDELDHPRRDGEIPGREPVRLEDDDVVVLLPAGQLAGDDLLKLVHLEPVEDAL